MHVVLDRVKHCTVRVHTLVGPDKTIDTIRRVMVHEHRVEHELRRNLIDHIAVLGAYDNLLREHFHVAS